MITTKIFFLFTETKMIKNFCKINIIKLSQELHEAQLQKFKEFKRSFLVMNRRKEDDQLNDDEWNEKVQEKFDHFQKCNSKYKHYSQVQKISRVFAIYHCPIKILNSQLQRFNQNLNLK